MRKPEVKVGKWDFYKVKIEDKEFFTYFIHESPCPINLWSANFPFIWAYSQSPRRELLWRIIDDMLVTFTYSRNQKLSLFCLPFGEGDANHLVKVLYKAMDFCERWNRVRGFKTKVRTINNDQLKYLQKSKEFNNLFFLVKTKGIERHYSIPDLVALKGKKFDSLRRTVNKYYREYPNITIREYHSREYKSLLAFNRSWEKTAGVKYRSIIDRSYFKEIVKRHKELGLMILVAEEKDEIVGVNIAGLLPNGEAWGCICKTKKEIRGLYEAIVLELIKQIHHHNSNVKFLNVGSDMGIEGLRRFKEKFKPALNLERYRVFLKEQ